MRHHLVRISANRRVYTGAANAIVAAVLVTAMVQPCSADTLLGRWVKTTHPDGSMGKAKEGSEIELYRAEDGHYYLKEPLTKTYHQAGTMYRYEDEDGNVIKVTQPDLGGNAAGFAFGVNELIDTTLAGLMPLTPDVGLLIYPLDLTGDLQALGDIAGLWGDTPPFPTLTDAVFGVQQGDTILSLLGSSTPDGLNAIRYDYDPSVIGLTLEFGTLLEAEFVLGDTYVPLGPGTSFGVTGIPSPATLGLLALGGFFAKRRRRR